MTAGQTTAILFTRCSSSGSLEGRQDTTRQVEDLQHYADTNHIKVIKEGGLLCLGEYGLNNGCDIKSISALMGHSSVLTTEKVYAAVLPETLQKTVEKSSNFKI